MRTFARFSCLSIVLIFAAASAQSADWPQWLGPTRNGVSPEAVATWKDAPKVAWRHPVSQAFSSPIVANGLVFVHASVAGKEAEEVLAFDAKTGESRLRDVYPRAKYRSQLGVGPRATPSVADGLLFTFGITGTLTCYEAKSGKRHWQVNPYEANKLSLPRFGVCSSPVVGGGRVLVLVGGNSFAVAAYDIASGKLAWKALDEPAGAASPTILFHSKREQGDQFVAQTTLRLVGLDPQHGAIQWEHPLVFEPSGVSPTPFVVDDFLLCTTQDSGTLAVSLPGKGQAAPKLKWSKADLSGYFSTGTLGPEGTVLVVTNVLSPLPRADLCCLDPVHGDELWCSRGLGYFHAAVLAAANGKLIILDDAGLLILAQVTRKGFKELAKSCVCRGTFNSPALSNGRLYVRDSQELICLQIDAPEPNKSAGR